MAEQGDGQELAELTVRACEYCSGAIPKRRKDARFCSTSHRVMAHRKAKREAEIRNSLVTQGLTDQSLTSLHAQAVASRRDGPRQYDDFGLVPGDFELAAELDAEDQEGIYYGDPAPEGNERDARFNSMIQHQARRTPREIWKRWREYGRRHGTEHPDQTADRVARQRAADAARAGRIDARTDGRPQDKYDKRTAGNVASNARQSRRLNARHVDQPPLFGPGTGWDFEAEQIDGSLYRREPGDDRRSRHADYAWDLGTTGFRY